ncbi:MAG: hypothetical protein ACM3PF_00930 [Bacteroidota bacterium]
MALPDGIGEEARLSSTEGARPSIDVQTQLTRLQPVLTLPRETVPRLTAREVGAYLRAAAERLGLEFAESTAVVPTFLLLPRTAPRAVLFQTWHAEPLPVEPGAVDGAERLALGAAVAGAEAAATALGSQGAPVLAPFAFVVAPSATAGSQLLDEVLRERRARLGAPAAIWLRIAPAGGSRRAVFLGARGRVVVGVRGGDGNPYRARDAVVAELREGAYGPRPLDFELMRKLAQRPENLALLPPDENGTPEERIRHALFEPHGEIVVPGAAHPDRPRAWLTFEIAEAMEPEPIARRVEALSGGGRADLVERFPWDRANIHHPTIHALIELAREVSEGAEIWPSSPWATPSGLFTRALGTNLVEWRIPLPAGAAIRLPGPQPLEAMAREAANLLLKLSAQAP